MTRSAAPIWWRLAVYLGAGLGGVFWGILANVIVYTGTDAERAAADGRNWALALSATALLLAVGGLLTWLGRTSVVRSVGVALILVPLTGWIFVATYRFVYWNDHRA